MPDSAPKSDEKVTKGQPWSAVEFHPLPARRPSISRWSGRCH